MRDILLCLVLCSVVGAVAYSCGKDSFKRGYSAVDDKYKEVREGLRQRDSCIIALLDSAGYYIDDCEGESGLQVAQYIDDMRCIIDGDEYDVYSGIDELNDVLYNSWFNP